MFAYCLNNPILLADTDGTAPSAIWYYMFVSSEYGFIHKCVQAEIVAYGLGDYAMEKGIVRADGSRGRVDIVSSFGEVWEIKHANSTNPTAALLCAEKQALSYIDSYCAYITNNISSLGPAGYFSGTFVINCLDTSYEVMYCTPSDGVILYTVKTLEEYQQNPRYVFTPKEVTNHSINKEAVKAGAVGLATISVFALYAYGIKTLYSQKQLSESYAR